MKIELPEIRPEERTPLVEALLTLLRQVLDRVQQLEDANQQLRDEVAVLQGQKPRPTIRPSQLEDAAPSLTPTPQRPASPKRPMSSRRTVHREVKLHLDDLPPGAVFRATSPSWSRS